MAGLAVSCATHKPLDRVRISQPNMEQKADTTYKLPQMIKWTDEKGQTRIVTQAERDSVTGEEITTVQLSEITVTASVRKKPGAMAFTRKPSPNLIANSPAMYFVKLAMAAFAAP